MNYLFPALTVTLSLVAGNAALGPNPAAVAAIPDSPAELAGEVYRVSSGVRSCTLSKAAPSAAGISTLRADRRCDEVLPGLAGAKLWRENADGSVTIDADDAPQLITLSVADGAAYETFRPADPQITLTFGY